MHQCVTFPLNEKSLLKCYQLLILIGLYAQELVVFQMY